MASSSDTIIFARDDLDLIVEFAGCSLDESPGKNWVESGGGLPEYICRIARAIKKTGKSTSQAIAIAVSRVKKWAAGGDDVDADTKAKAAKALSEWERLKGKNKAKKSDHLAASSPQGDVLMLANKVTSFNVDAVRRAWELHDRAQRQTFRANNPNAPYSDFPEYGYVHELWTDHLIVKKGELRLYKVPYTVDSKSQVTFGDEQQVQTKYVAIKSDDMVGAELSDQQIRSLADQIGPCYDKATDQVLLSISQRPSALDAVLAYRTKG